MLETGANCESVHANLLSESTPLEQGPNQKRLIYLLTLCSLKIFSWQARAKQQQSAAISYRLKWALKCEMDLTQRAQGQFVAAPKKRRLSPQIADRGAVLMVQLPVLTVAISSYLSG